MTLEGSLDAFSLPDIFQLLSFTKKSGALHITSSDSSGVVYFTTGTLTGGSSDIGRQALGRRLVGAGLVDDMGLDRAVSAAGTGSGGLAKALHDAGAVDEGVLHEHVVEQTLDAVFDLLRWTAGDFAFVGDEANPDDLGVTLAVDEVIAEARRRLETWESLIRTVPAPDRVVSVALRPIIEDITLTNEEWSLLALVDGRRTVADLVRLSGRGEFATVRTLASLVARSLLVVHNGSDRSQDGVATLLQRQAKLAELEGRPEPQPEPEPEPEPISRPAAPVAPVAAAPAPTPPPVQRLASVPDVVSQRPEAATARAPRFPEEPVRRPATESALPAPARVVNGTAGNAAVATAADPAGPLIERDPSVNKSLLLRLIAGVRGL